MDVVRLAQACPNRLVTLVYNFTPPPPVCFPLITEKRDICAKIGIPNLTRSPDIGQNSDRGISDFQISSQSLTKENVITSESEMILT